LKFEFKKHKKRIFYLFYVPAVTLAFLYVLFPAAALKSALTERLNRVDPHIRFTVAELKPALPVGIKLDRVDILVRNVNLIDVDTVKIAPNLLSLFGSRCRIKFYSRACAGRLDGRAQFSHYGNGEEQTAAIRIRDIQLHRIAALRLIEPRKVSGLLGGEISYRDDGARRSLTSHLTVTAGRVELPDAPFGQQFLEFNKLDIDLTLKESTLKVNYCRLRGRQLEAQVSGTIELNMQLGDSWLDLAGSVTPRHVLLAKIKANLPAGLMEIMQAGRRQIGFKIGGTLDDPVLSLN